MCVIGTCALGPDGVDTVLGEDTPEPGGEEGEAEGGRVHEEQAAPGHHVLELVVLLPHHPPHIGTDIRKFVSAEQTVK